MAAIDLNTNESAHAALREAHAHLDWLGRALDMLSLEACASADEALERVGERLASVRGTAWLLGHSARVAAWREGRWFERARLDALTGDRPCALLSFDHHAVFANSAALAIGGISRSTPDPAGGVIQRDPQGEPTGLLLEAAAFGLWGLAPEPPETERPALIGRALDHLWNLGFAEVHDMFSRSWMVPILADALRTRSMRVRLFAGMEELDSIARDRDSWESDALRLAGGKIFIDGTLNSRTAWMLEPYADAPAGLERGKALLSTRQIAEAIDRCHNLRIGLAMHAIGDGAVRAGLDAIEDRRQVVRGMPPVRIEHCELIDQRDVPRFAELGVTASVQPCHLLADIEALMTGVPGRLDRVMPWRDLVRFGLLPGKTLLFGSDVPVVRADPIDSIIAATKRCRPGGAPIAPEQALPEEVAWACFRGSDK
ncbi:MAG: amidohydrolase family protein [Planctomycetes bacterium]|nr:amidohydrolase family protein [Planctomycetota bacterium]